MEGGVRRKMRGGGKRLQRNFTAMPMAYIDDQKVRAGLVQNGGVGMLIGGVELLYGVAHGVMELF